MAKTTPTQRTLAALRKDGWQCAIVEKWIPQTKRRADLFGGIDIVAVRPGRTLGVQCTSVANQSLRIAKLQALPGMRAWLEAGNWLEVWGWSARLAYLKNGKRGKAKRWQRTIHEITLDELTDARGQEQS